MTIDEKIGQRFIVGIKGEKIDADFISLVKEFHVANVILFGRNIRNRQQLGKLCTDIQGLVMQETGHGAFITIDQEGGVVTRLSGDMINCPGAMATAATGNPENVYRTARITASELKSVGINFNLAPDLDINCNPDNPVIGVRSFGDTPETVIEFGLNMIKGLKDGEILSCAKHFPGHGDTAVDSHIGLPCIDKSKEELLAFELLPFIEAIRNNVPAIMSSHILFPKIEPANIPATMSRKIITDLLKEELGFKGLILSDCMEMDAIKKYYGTVNGVKAAFSAGVDLVFVSHTAELTKEAIKTVKEAYESGQMPLTELDESVEKVIRYKEKYISCSQNIDASYNWDDEEYINCGADRNTDMKKISDEIRNASLTHVSGEMFPPGDAPLFIGCNNFRANQASSDMDKHLNFADFLCSKLGGRAITTSPNPDESEIKKIISEMGNPTSIIYATYNGHVYSGQLSLGKQLAVAGIPMAAFTLRNPYDLSAYPEQVAKYAAWEYTEESLKMVYRLLSGRLEAKGKMPIKL